MVGPAVKREAVAHLQAVVGLSERRACSIVGADRKTVRYQSCRPPETELRGRLRDIANERRRFGYRRLFILLRREGEPSGINRIYRLYREEGLTVRKRRSRRRAVGTRAPIEAVIPAKNNRRDPIPHDKAKYKWRNQVERLFNKLKNWRRIAARYDNTKESYLGFVAIAAVKLWRPFVHER